MLTHKILVGAFSDYINRPFTRICVLDILSRCFLALDVPHRSATAKDFTSLVLTAKRRPLSL